jgi:hypothetical protein
LRILLSSYSYSGPGSKYSSSNGTGACFGRQRRTTLATARADPQRRFAWFEVCHHSSFPKLLLGELVKDIMISPILSDLVKIADVRNRSIFDNSNEINIDHKHTVFRGSKGPIQNIYIPATIR